MCNNDINKSYDTCGKHKYSIRIHKSSRYEKGPKYVCTKVIQKRAVKEHFTEHCFYNIPEILNLN